MPPHATASSKGQVTLPKAIRDQLGLVEGTRLDFDIVDGAIRVRPVSNTALGLRRAQAARHEERQRPGDEASHRGASPCPVRPGRRRSAYRQAPGSLWMIGFDTNVLVRLLVNDDAAQARAVRKLLEPINDTPEAVFLSDLVIGETLWVLKTRYAMDKAALAGVIDLLLSVKTFAFEHRPTLEQAVTAFRSSKAGFADCRSAARNRRLGCNHTVRFDKALMGYLLLGRQG